RWKTVPLLSALDCYSRCAQSGKSGRSGEETLREARRHLQLEHSCGPDRARADRLAEDPTLYRSKRGRTQQGATMRKMSDFVRNQNPPTLPPDATVEEACRYMRDRRVGAVVVTKDDGRVIGIFTGRDAVHRVLAESKSAGDTKLTE